MEEDTQSSATQNDIVVGERARRQATQPSSGKAMRTVLLAVLFHLSWPRYLTKQEIIEFIPSYGDNPDKAFYRDMLTLTDCNVDDLPAPDADNMASWCENQQCRRRLAIVYDRQQGAFKLHQALFSFDIHNDEARAFVALKDGFVPGAPYAKAVQSLLERWAWLLSEQGKMLVAQKRQRKARPVLLPLSPVTDYRQHEQVILRLDAALENGMYISFDYTPLSHTWNDPPEMHLHVEPYELEYREGHWYFTAYVESRNTFLDYRVDRIHPASLRQSEERDHFYPGNRTRPGVKITYWVAPEMARHNTLSARLREQKVTLLGEGQGARVEGNARSIWWATKLLLGYGDQVKALEPLALVARMRERTRATARLYGEEE